MNKKAIAFDFVAWIFRLIFMIIVVMVVVFLVSAYTDYSVDVFDIESDLYLQRILYSREGVSYYDKDINRLYPGIIEKDKFTQDILGGKLESITDYGEFEAYYGAKLVLFHSDQNKPVGTIYVNETSYNNLIKVAQLNLRGPGGAQVREKHIFVMIKEGDVLSHNNMK